MSMIADNLQSMICYTLIALFLCSFPASGNESSMETIRKRTRRSILHHQTVNVQNINRLMKKMNSDGSWSDVDYDDQSRADWAPIQHLERLEEMARAYSKKDSKLHKNQTVLNHIESGLTFWFDDEPSSDNWWWGDIGRPKRLGPILIMLKDMLSKELLRAGIEQMPDELRKHKGTDSDEILNDEFLIHRGLVEEDPDLIRKVFDHMLSELAIRSGIGIKADFSFHNHGPQLYSGSYGIGAVRAFAKWASFARGTTFAFPEEKRRLFAQFLLEGYRWMSWYKLLDYGTLGRAISRKGRHNRARSLLSPLRKLSKLVPSREEEITSFIRHIKGEPPKISGNRNFWLSDFMVHRRRDYYTSVSLTSEDVIGTEIGNGEALQSIYLPFGSNFHFHGKPDEYRGIFPVWNWTRIPGVTAPHASKPPIPVDRTDSGWARIQGQTDFVGGCSTGKYGLIAFDYRLKKTSGRKGWFFFDRAYVCMGAGIQSEAKQPVITTVDQSLRSGDLLVASDTGSYRSLSHGQSLDVQSPVRVHHDRIGYVFPRTGASVHVGSRTQTGSWNRINLKYTDKKRSKKVFNLWRDHGKQPTDGRYMYIVAPGRAPGALSRYVGSSSPIQVLSNTPAIQAVRHRKLDLTMAAFYASGSVPLNNRHALTVDTPCLVIVSDGPDGTQVTVSNPEGNEKTVNVQVHEKGNTDRVVASETVQLPGGRQGGSSVVGKLKSK